jgi:tripartite-type tricarboxylate transporter receptor subunit TctC
MGRATVARLRPLSLEMRHRDRPIAIAAESRSKLLPDVPTIVEAFGINDAEYSTWYGFLAPPKTPSEIIKKLEDAAIEALGDVVLQKKIAELGFEIVGLRGPQFAARIKDETQQIRKTVHRLNVTMQ